MLDDSACKHGVPRCRVGAVRTMRLWEKQEVQFCSKSVKIKGSYISNHLQIWPPIFLPFEYGRLCIRKLQWGAALLGVVYTMRL